MIYKRVSCKKKIKRTGSVSNEKSTPVVQDRECNDAVRVVSFFASRTIKKKPKRLRQEELVNNAF